MVYTKYFSGVRVNTLPAKLYNLNFLTLKVVSRNLNSQLQVAENYSYLFNFRPNIANLMFNLRNSELIA